MLLRRTLPSALPRPACGRCKHQRTSAMGFKTLTALILSAGLIAGCGINPRGLHADCDWAEPILASRQDSLSEGTLAQIVAHNEIGARLCGWVP